MADEIFLEILKSSLAGEALSSEHTIDEAELQHILRLAEIHKVLPLVYDTIYRCMELPKEHADAFKRISKFMVSQQAIKSLNFLKTYSYLSAAGVEPVVMKGIICRNLYPKPDLRISADEDIYIPEEAAHKCHELLISAGFTLKNPDSPDGEAIYINNDGLYLELHKELFSKENDLLFCSDFFRKALKRTVYTKIDSVKLRTFEVTDHLLFMLLHTAKHFLYSGVGIRQVCDVVMISNTCYNEINWDFLYEKCKEFGILTFAQAIFAIGLNHLGLKALPEKFTLKETNETPLLQDILSAGIYGSSSLSRLHSSQITVNMSPKSKGSLLKSIFPPCHSLNGRYAYARKHPVLLPFAWIHRLFRYCVEVKKSKSSSATEAIRIGNHRAELIKLYKLK